MLSDMSAEKSITGRELRRGTPEEKLRPGESITVRKQGGKVFELRRLDSGERSLVKQADALFQEVPNPGQQVRTNLARVIVEDRE
jgi:hypothetical protein